MKMVKLAAKTFSKVVANAAKTASGTASWVGTCQPKEPANIRERLAKK